MATLTTDTCIRTFSMTTRIHPTTTLIQTIPRSHILTAGAIDSHVHFISPNQIPDAFHSGITTLIGGGTGPATGPGSSYYWSGNDQVGAGRVTLISAGDGKVDVEMEVRKPSPSSSDHHFTVAPDGDGTLVTWSVSGEKDASGKAFGFFAVPADEMGSDMEKSLARLSAVVVAEGKVATN